LFDASIESTTDIIKNMAVNSSSDVNNNIGTNSTVNINNPKFKATIGDRGINNIAAALSSAGGATAGLKVAQHIGGTPSTKLAVGLATMTVVQAGTSIMSKILNNNTSVMSNTVNKLISNIASSNTNNENVINNYPLNLLEDVNLLLYY
jgi:hypothetical protein